MISATYTRVDLNAGAGPDVQSCLDYWNRLRGDRLAPTWKEFDWFELPLNVIPHCGVVDIQYHPIDFIYRFWGTAQVTLHHQELTGQSVNEMRPKAEGRSVFNQYKNTLDARQPSLFQNNIVAGKYGISMIEWSLRLPFSDDGEVLSQILGFSHVGDDYEYLMQAIAEE